MANDNPCNTLEYAKWLEARHERPEQGYFHMRQYERGMGVMDEIAVRAYEDTGRFLEMVEPDIEHLRLQWKLLHNDAYGDSDASVYCQFRVFIKVPGMDEVECGYDDPPGDLAMDAERKKAFDDMVESCELVDPGEWNHLVEYQLFKKPKFRNCTELIQARNHDNLDEFIAARQQWLMNQIKPETAAAAPRPAPRV